LLPLLLLLPTQYKGSGQAIAVGSVGIYATCDAGKDKKATDELIAMLEEVRHRAGHHDALYLDGRPKQLHKYAAPASHRLRHHASHYQRYADCMCSVAAASGFIVPVALPSFSNVCLLVGGCCTALRRLSRAWVRIM
jgi:hypothetical protein